MDWLSYRFSEYLRWFCHCLRPFSSNMVTPPPTKKGRSLDMTKQCTCKRRKCICWFFQQKILVTPTPFGAKPTHVRGMTRSVSSRGVGKVMSSILGPNRVIAKDVKSCIYCWDVRCATFIKKWVGGMSWPKTGVLKIVEIHSRFKSKYCFMFKNFGDISSYEFFSLKLWFLIQWLGILAKSCSY